jgi:glycerol-3-phosphate O-acyltransferase
MIWIAPSGGRDRPDPITGEWYPVSFFFTMVHGYVFSQAQCHQLMSALGKKLKHGQAPFDASSTDNMRRLVENFNTLSHIYPLALLCYEIMPPPPQVIFFSLLMISVVIAN